MKKNKDLEKQYVFLEEVTHIIKPADITIIEESKTEDGDLKAIFIAKLQTAEEKNQNGRFYSRAVCQEIVNQLKPKAKSRALLSEVDHPGVASSDPMVIKRRAGTIEIKNCGALIRDIKMVGNDVIAEVETLSGFNGPSLAALILYDKIDIGFSLRALGAVENKPNGTIEVKSPIKAITYDVVSNPSHASARIMEYLPESISTDINNNSTFIFEDTDLSILEMDDVSLHQEDCSDSYLDQMIKDRFYNSLGKTHFKITR